MLYVILAAPLCHAHSDFEQAQAVHRILGHACRSKQSRLRKWKEVEMIIGKKINRERKVKRNDTEPLDKTPS